MKISYFVEMSQKKVKYKDLEDKAKELWKCDGNKIKDLNTMELYYKVEESKCFYVFNQDIQGFFEV
jgi:hypothetical protein